MTDHGDENETMDDAGPPLEGAWPRYENPPETPREEMWHAIAARIREQPTHRDQATVVDLDRVRADRRRRSDRWRTRRVTWAAAAAVLVVGIALGRVTAPDSPAGPAPAVQPPTVAAPSTGGLDLAAREHLGRSESLLLMVRTDAREGRIDPAAATWARSLLTETRLLMDVREGADPNLDRLLQELELVLMQIVGATETGGDEARMRTELDLAVGALESRDVLPRIRAAMPAGMAGA